MNEREFLDSYDKTQYDRPSVTVDALVFSMSEEHNLEVLLVRRKNHPYRGKWAVPGGFCGIEESLEDAAKRELREETGLEDVYMEQLYTFGKPGRDPRMRVISVCYMALVPESRLQVMAGDDAADAVLFEITNDQWELKFTSKEKYLAFGEKKLAFDHLEIIRMGLQRLAGKLDYSDVALELLEDKSCFTILEYKKIYEAISGNKADRANFRRYFARRYINSGKVTEVPQSGAQQGTSVPRYCYMERK